VWSNSWLCLIHFESHSKQNFHTQITGNVLATRVVRKQKQLTKLKKRSVQLPKKRQKTTKDGDRWAKDVETQLKMEWNIMLMQHWIYVVFISKNWWP